MQPIPITFKIIISFFISLSIRVRLFNINVQLIVGDLPARSKYNLLSGHTGYFSCTRCLLEGTHCDIHRHIFYSWIEYQTTRPEPRTQQNIDYCVSLIEKSKSKIRPYGVLGKSPLSTILSIPTQSVFDYFYICLKVHLPVLITHWIDLLPKAAVDKANAYLSDILYPHTFNRLPKNLSVFNQWKASQMRTFFLCISLPLLVHLDKSFPSVIIRHFSLLFVYLRTLIFFYNRSDIYAMCPFIECYLEQFPLIYGACAELLSTHILIHLWKQSHEHGALAFHSMFTIESSLNHLAKMGHGTISLGTQISFWYCIDRYLYSRKVKRTSNTFLDNYFFDQSITKQYYQQFSYAFFQFFRLVVAGNIRFYDRLHLGISVYHSLAYKLRKTSVSYRVCLYNSSCSKLICFGEILFFFSYRDEKFFFVKQILCSSSSSLSNRLNLDDSVASWSDRINQYFHCVHSSSIVFRIYPCTSLLRKSIFLPFDGDIILTPNIDHELEHD